MRLLFTYVGLFWQMENGDWVVWRLVGGVSKGEREGGREGGRRMNDEGGRVGVGD